MRPEFKTYMHTTLLVGMLYRDGLFLCVQIQTSSLDIHIHLSGISSTRSKVLCWLDPLPSIAGLSSVRIQPSETVLSSRTVLSAEGARSATMLSLTAHIYGMMWLWAKQRRYAMLLWPMVQSSETSVELNLVRCCHITSRFRVEYRYPRARALPHSNETLTGRYRMMRNLSVKMAKGSSLSTKKMRMKKRLISSLA